MDFRFSLSNSVKSTVGMLMGIPLNLCNNLGEIVIFIFRSKHEIVNILTYKMAQKWFNLIINIPI